MKEYNRCSNNSKSATPKAANEVADKEIEEEYARKMKKLETMMHLQWTHIYQRYQ
jgi:hypothetical protein